MLKVGNRAELDALAGRKPVAPKLDDAALAAREAATSNRELLASIVRQQAVLTAVVTDLTHLIQRPTELEATIERDRNNRMTKVLITRNPK